GSAASAAIRARAKRCAFRPAAPSASSRVKTCKTSGNRRASRAASRLHYTRSVDPLRDDPERLPPPVFVWQPPRPKFQDRVWLHVTLLVLTIVTTTLAGVDHYAAFMSDFREGPLRVGLASLLLHGLWYSGTILAILGSHELGHYLACRYYDVDASRPFFLPVPFVLTGTMGAFIRIREPIPQKRM